MLSLHSSGDKALSSRMVATIRHSACLTTNRHPSWRCGVGHCHSDIVHYRRCVCRANAWCGGCHSSTALDHRTRFLVVGWAGRVSLTYTAIRFFSRSIPRFRQSIYLPAAPSRFQNDDSSARLYSPCEAAHFCCSRCIASGDIGATTMAL